MLKYILKRLGLAVLILIGVSLIIYILVRMMPTNYVENLFASINQTGEADTELLDKMMDLYGLNDSIPVGYAKWLSNLARFDLGNSFITEERVVDVIRDKMWVSFAIAAIATVFEFLIAIPLGITAATHQYSVRDYVVTVFVMVGISLPAFYLGQLLKFVFCTQLGWFPFAGMTDGTLGDLSFFAQLGQYFRFFFLPILTVIILSIGARMRMTRTNMLEVLNSDYIRTARAKGLKERKVIYRHAFRNTLIPLVTSLGGLLPSLFSGAIITEQVFDIEGIGNVAFDAMQKGDIPFIMGYNMFLAVLSVLGILLADLLYVLVDPRVKLE